MTNNFDPVAAAERILSRDMSLVPNYPKSVKTQAKTHRMQHLLARIISINGELHEVILQDVIRGKSETYQADQRIIAHMLQEADQERVHQFTLDDGIIVDFTV